MTQQASLTADLNMALAMHGKCWYLTAAASLVIFLVYAFCLLRTNSMLAASVALNCPSVPYFPSLIPATLFRPPIIFLLSSGLPDIQFPKLQNKSDWSPILDMKFAVLGLPHLRAGFIDESTTWALVGAGPSSLPQI